MRNFYARFVLWLIRPALEEADRRAYEASKTVIDVVERNLRRSCSRKPDGVSNGG